MGITQKRIYFHIKLGGLKTTSKNPQLEITSKTKELANLFPLSNAGIENRERHLKALFGVKEASDRELILLAKEKGFLCFLKHSLSLSTF